MVLDTCALIAWADGLPMRSVALDAIRAAQPSGEIFVPTVAALEIAQKAFVGKLRFGPGIDAEAYVGVALSPPGLRTIPLSVEIALGAYRLPEPFHRDPADRIIVATARLLGAPVVTSDRRILAYAAAGHVGAVPC